MAFVKSIPTNRTIGNWVPAGGEGGERGGVPAKRGVENLSVVCVFKIVGIILGVNERFEVNFFNLLGRV